MTLFQRALRVAILEDWEELEAEEVNGALVIQLKKGIEFIEAKNIEEPKKRGRPAWLHKQ